MMRALEATEAASSSPFWAGRCCTAGPGLAMAGSVGRRGVGGPRSSRTRSTSRSGLGAAMVTVDSRQLADSGPCGLALACSGCPLGPSVPDTAGASRTVASRLAGRP